MPRLSEGEQEAARLTASAQEATHVAAKLLLQGFDNLPMINSLGIFAHPTVRRAELSAAREAIGRALSAIEALVPPSQSRRPRAANVALLVSPDQPDPPHF